MDNVINYISPSLVKTNNKASTLVMTEHIALCSAIQPNTIKPYKQFIQASLLTLSDYNSLLKIPVSEIKGFIKPMIADNKTRVSYQHSLVGVIKKLCELTQEEKIDIPT